MIPAHAWAAGASCIDVKGIAASPSWTHALHACTDLGHDIFDPIISFRFVRTRSTYPHYLLCWIMGGEEYAGQSRGESTFVIWGSCGTLCVRLVRTLNHTC